MIDDCPLSGTESDDGVRSLDSAPSTAMDRTIGDMLETRL